MMNLKEKIQIILGILILIAVLSTIYNWPDAILSTAIDWSVPILISLILSGVSGQLIEGFSGDYFKKIFIIIPVGPFKFSVSLFVILTLLLKWILF